MSETSINTINNTLNNSSELEEIKQNSNKIFNDELNKVKNVLAEAANNNIDYIFDDKFINNKKGINKNEIDRLEQDRNEILNKLKNQLTKKTDTTKFDNTKLFTLLSRIQPITYKEFIDCLETDKLDYPNNNFDCTLLHLALLSKQYYIAKKLIEKGVFIDYNIKNILHNEKLLIEFFNMYDPVKLYNLILSNKIDKISRNFLINYVYITNYNVIQKLYENGITIDFKDDFELSENIILLKNKNLFYDILNKNSVIIYNNDLEKQIIDNLDYLLNNDKLIINEKTNKKTNKKINEKTNEKTNEKLNEKTNEKTNEKLNEKTNENILHSTKSSINPDNTYISLSDLFNKNKMVKEHYITEDEKLNALKILFNQGFNLIDDAHKFSNSIIYYLIEHKYEDIAIYLINKGLKYDYPLECIDRPVYGCYHKKNDKIEEYIDPLIYSVKYKLYKLTDLLLDKNINIETSIFKNAFYYTIKNRNYDLAKKIMNKSPKKSILINNLMKIKDYKYSFKYSYLYIVLSNCDYDFALYLIKEGIKITFGYKKYFNNSLLYYAIRRCKIVDETFMHQYRQITDYKDFNDPDITPPTKEQVELVKCLLENDVQINYDYDIMHNITVIQYIEKFYPTEIIELVKKRLNDFN